MMCAACSDHHVRAMAISGGDAAHKRREQCILKALARNSKRRHCYGCAPIRGSTDRVQREDSYALAQMYIYTYVCMCFQGANATRVFISMDHALNSAHHSLSHLTGGHCINCPLCSNLAVASCSKALMATATSVKVTVAEAQLGCL